MFASSYKKQNNDYVQHNVNHVVDLASKKLKDLISKKQEQVSKNSILKGQKNVMNSDIKFHTKEAKSKEDLIEKMIEEFNIIGQELIELEKEYAVTMQEYKMKEEEMKNTVLSVNDDVSKVEECNQIENESKKQNIKIEYENLMQVKNENKELIEEHYNLKKELYVLDLEYKDTIKMEELRNLKARKGIDLINKMYFFEYKEEDEKNSG